MKIVPDADSALVETVLSRRESAADRCRALRLLGFTPEGPMRVVAVATETDHAAAVETIALMAQRQMTPPAHVAVVGGVVAVLFQACADPSGEHLRAALRQCNSDNRIVAAVRVGVGGLVDSLDAEISWEQALLALRFTTTRDGPGRAGGPGYTLVEYDSLGVLTILADVETTRLQCAREVMALDALAATENGAQDIGVLEAFCLTGSLRQAALVLYLHHSTVAARLARIEKKLGWRLDDPADRFKAQFALLARRLAHAATYR